MTKKPRRISEPVCRKKAVSRNPGAAVPEEKPDLGKVIPDRFRIYCRYRVGVERKSPGLHTVITGEFPGPGDHPVKERVI